MNPKFSLKNIMKILCVLTILFCISKDVNASGMPEQKVRFAEITDGYMSNSKAKAGDTISYSFIIQYNGVTKAIKDNWFLNTDKPQYSKPISVCVIWKSSKTQEIERTYAWKPDGSGMKMEISDQIKVTKGMQPGVWHLQEIRLQFGWEEYTEYGDSIKPAELTIVDLKEESSWDFTTESDLSFAEFTVNGTKADTKAPVINTKSLKVSKKKVKNNEKSTFSVKLKDDSVIAYVECEWEITGAVRGKENGRQYSDDYEYMYVSKMKYNKKKKTYQGTVKLEKHDKKARLVSVSAADIYGNKMWHHYRDSGKYKKAYSKVTVYAK